MAYSLGIDIGTTYTAAAVNRGGRPEVLSLGTDRPTVPTVVLLRSDGTVLVGEAAERRAMTEPTRVAREFKRRMGDPTPFIVGGTPYGIEALTAHVIRWVLALATEREGEPPAQMILTHPAAWGTYKLDLLDQAARLADGPPTAFLSEPQAAALRYAQEGRVEAGDSVVVYDFGGGTLDVALVRCLDAERFALIGRPAGMERLGGIDFDQAVFAHVNDALDGMLTDADPADPQVRAALTRVREDCRLAKEALSSDTDAVIPVLLPNLQTDVRITRAEFESMIRPRIVETIETLERTVRSAGMGMADPKAVLLVGGTSRIPLIREMVHAETGLPVTLDSHPKTTISLGAALHDTAERAVTAAPPPIVPTGSGAEQPAATPLPPAGEHHGAGPSADARERSVEPVRAGPKWNRGIPIWAIGVVAAAIVAVIGGIWLVRSGGNGATEADPTTTVATSTSSSEPGQDPLAASVPSDVTTSTPTTTTTPTTTAPTTTTATSSANSTPGYVRVVDATGSLSVEVPEAWTDIEREGLFLFDTPSPHISASPDLFGYVDTWTTSGITVAVVDAADADDPTMLNQAMALAFGYADACIDGGTEQYVGNGLNGETWIWLDCDGTGNVLITVAATSGGDYYYVVIAQATTNDDLVALDQALASVEYRASG